MSASAEKKPDLAPRDLIARWSRARRTGGPAVPLRAQFAEKPKHVRMSDRKGTDELRAVLQGLDAPPGTMERALDETVGGEDVSVWTVSNRAVDSYKTTFDPDGWDLDAFRKNPVVLFAHDRSSLPIGKDIGAWIQPGKALMGVTRYAPHDVNPMGHAVGAMVRWGGLNAVSVGFEPLEWEEADERDDGNSWFIPVDFKKQRLNEYSVVPVPSNPEALLEGRTLREHLRAEGVDMRAMIEWCERALDGEPTAAGPLNVPRFLVERARAAIIPVGEGLVLAPSSFARAESDEEKKAADEEEKAEEDAEELAPGERASTLQCPECGYEGEASAFAMDPEPTEEERAAVEKMSDRALLALARKRGLDVGRVDPAADEVPDSGLDAFAKRAAMTASRAATKAVTEVYGLLPGGASR